MRIGLIAAVLATTGLSACGEAASPEFVTAIAASCEKTQGGKVDCACIAEALDKELDGDSKTALLAINAGIDAGKSQVEALQAAGIAPGDAQALMETLVPALANARAACPLKR